MGPAGLPACPFPDVVFAPLPLSALSSSPFHCALHHGDAQRKNIIKHHNDDGGGGGGGGGGGQ